MVNSLHLFLHESILSSIFINFLFFKHKTFITVKMIVQETLVWTSPRLIHSFPLHLALTVHWQIDKDYSAFISYKENLYYNQAFLPKEFNIASQVAQG